ncbi:MAG: class II aldolase/adducin family protein, partial [Pseudomonadales bacterium]
PGDEEQFLINPYGLRYDEVTASNLVKVDIKGNVIGDSKYRVNPAGMIIHSAIHGARHDVGCIAHTHTTAGMAVACQEGGLRIDNFYSVLLHNRIAYHGFEGITVVQGEQERLIENLGDKNVMILRSHGLLACGRTIAATFIDLWLLQRACEIQMATDATGRPVMPVAEEIGEKSEELLKIQTAGADQGELEFAALVRKIEQLDPSYKD